MDLKHRQRAFLGVFFFLSGFCFSTWASRIPTIKVLFDLNKAELGTVLVFMPMSSMLGLPISGWLVTRYHSRIPLIISFSLLTVSLCLIGFASSMFMLVVSQCMFAFSIRICNISMNTQALTVQRKFERNINGSFHGLWSTGGIAGISFSTFMVATSTSITAHFLAVSAGVFFVGWGSYQFLIREDLSGSGNKFIVGKPDPYILYLGLLLFFAGICEGGMFDWSGVYFKEVVGEKIFTLGYLSFMTSMALSRFTSDYIIEYIGMPKAFIISASLIFSGILMATLFPSFWTSLAGFCLVGAGTASVIPMTFVLSTGSKKYSAGMAISILSTYGIAGMFIGPPLIGYLSHGYGLRFAFGAFALAGLMLVPVSQMFFRHRKMIS